MRPASENSRVILNPFSVTLVEDQWYSRPSESSKSLTDSFRLSSFKTFKSVWFQCYPKTFPTSLFSRVKLKILWSGAFKSSGIYILWVNLIYKRPTVSACSISNLGFSLYFKLNSSCFSSSVFTTTPSKSDYSSYTPVTVTSIGKIVPSSYLMTKKLNT